MKKRVKILLIITLLLILIRVLNPVKVLHSEYEYDPLLDRLSEDVTISRYQEKAQQIGITSKTNLLHIAYIFIISFGLIFIIEKGSINKGKKEEIKKKYKKDNKIFDKWNIIPLIVLLILLSIFIYKTTNRSNAPINPLEVDNRNTENREMERSNIFEGIDLPES